MKNAMKKLMAFALVAVMLVGALPFGVSAAGGKYSLGIAVGNGAFTYTDGNDETVAIKACSDLVGLDFSTVNGADVYVNGVATWVPADGSFDLRANTQVRIWLKEPEPEPVEISMTVNFGNGTSAVISAIVGEKIGYQNLPTNIERDGFDFVGYTIHGDTGYYTISHNTEAEEWMNGKTIVGSWTAVSCPECDWPIGEGHADDCDLNPNKPANTPEEPEDNEVQEPTDTKAYLNVFVNGVKKVQTYGSVNENVPVANCISAAEVNAANVTSVVLNNVNLPKDGSFNLGAAGSTTDIYLNVATSTGSTGNTGSTGGSSSNDTTEYAYAYIYVGDNSGYSRVYKNARAFSIAGVVDEFDDDMTSKHYSFDYYTIDGETGKNYDDSDVVQPGEVARVYVKVTESKLNNNKVYLQIYLNNNFDTPAKTLNVTSMASEDGLNLYGNVEDLILDNFTAKNSKGIKMDGMYESVGSWVADFLEDDKVSKRTADQIIEAKEESFVVYNIMVTNAKTGSSSTADDTNPKTGDQIMVPVAIMAVSASVLAAVAFYLNKKRVY